MTQTQYNQQVQKHAAFLGALFPGNKTAAKTFMPSMISVQTQMTASQAQCIDILLFSNHAHAGDVTSTGLGPVAWSAYVADVQAAVDSLP